MAKELYETVIPQTRYVIYEEKSSQYFHVGPTLPWRTDMMLVNSLLGSRYQKGRWIQVLGEWWRFRQHLEYNKESMKS